MLPKLLTDTTEIDKNLGFRYRTIYIYNENSELHYHNYYEIFLTLKDDVIHNINGEAEILARGTLVFIRKYDVHAYEYTSTSSPSFVNFAFTEEIMDSLFLFLSDGYASDKLLTMPHPPTIMLEESDIKWVLEQFQTLNATMVTDIPLMKYRSRLLLFKIFTRYFSQCTNIAYSTTIPRWLSDLDQEMQKLTNFSQPSEHMVQMSGKCRAYLGRMLKQHYNKTIPEYINDLRLNYWANCLLTSDAPILDICYDCGFENVSWAYTLFKQKYGVSPLKYRKTSK